MRRRPPLSAVLALAVTTTVTMLLPPSVGPASAKERQFYTRKKVKGRWVTGHFPAERGRRVATAPIAAEPEARPMPPERPLGGSPAPIGAQDRDVSTASISPAADDPARTDLLRAALEARARALAGPSIGSGLNVEPPAPPPPLGRLAPSVVTFDYRAGMRTTVFEDGAVVAEPFDATAGPPTPKR